MPARLRTVALAGVLLLPLAVATAGCDSRPGPALAPEISGTTVTGHRLTLASYRGHVVVLNFWGSWCPACRAEAPALSTLARQLYPGGVRFVGVDVLDEPAAALGFMQTFRISYPSISDPADGIALAFRRTVPPNALPDTIIINRAGRIAATVIGRAGYGNLRALIEKASARP